jgi:hypothetical protein
MERVMMLACVWVETGIVNLHLVAVINGQLPIAPQVARIEGGEPQEYP